MLGLIIAGVAPYASAQTAANFTSLHRVDCIAVTAVKNIYTPGDLYPAVVRCIEAKRYPESAALFMIAGTYGAFDKARVADSTAHEATQLLILQTIRPLDAEKKKQWQNAMAEATAAGSKKQAEICKAIAAIGMPKYYPTYMIQHGIQASLKNATPPLVSPFDSKAAWNSALTSYLRCSL
jgi:hypothetical protein